jgi:hypothetical protein
VRRPWLKDSRGEKREDELFSFGHKLDVSGGASWHRRASTGAKSVFVCVATIRKLFLAETPTLSPDFLVSQSIPGFRTNFQVCSVCIWHHLP